MSVIGGKLIRLLIVYFAGFLTAVYFLVPPEQQGPKSAVGSVAQIEQPVSKTEILQSVSNGLHKCVDVTKEAAKDVGAKIKQKIDEANQPTK